MRTAGGITMIKPDYYPQFRCIGRECKNNCCCGEWDIEVDDEAMERFDAISGEFGKRVRKAVDSNNVFIRKNALISTKMQTAILII
mgnify:CR=1 FL=1